MEFSLEPTVPGAALAALAVAGGGPLFGAGLRAARLRRSVSRLRERPLAEAPTGLVHTRGTVALDSPLFSPLTGRPCAGFRLVVSSARTRTGAVLESRRPFRIVVGDISARVMPEAARWQVGETGRREVGPGERLSEHLEALLNDRPEVAWLRRKGIPMRLAEHALLAGAECHVIGHARRARPYQLPAEMELAGTGTDGLSRVIAPAVRGGNPFQGERRQPGRPFPDEVDLWVEAGGSIDFVLVSDTAPVPADLATTPWKALGLLLGPALSFGGMLAMARIAEQLRLRERFF